MKGRARLSIKILVWYSVSISVGSFEDKNEDIQKNVSYFNFNLTQMSLNLTNIMDIENSTNTYMLNYVNYTNAVINNSSEADASRNRNITENLTEHIKEDLLPVPIMIAAPTVIVFIFIFLCVAYKFHSIQLDKQSKDIQSVPCSSCNEAQSLISPQLPSSFEHQCQPESDMCREGADNQMTQSQIVSTKHVEETNIGCDNQRIM